MSVTKIKVMSNDLCSNKECGYKNIAVDFLLGFKVSSETLYKEAGAFIGNTRVSYLNGKLSVDSKDKEQIIKQIEQYLYRLGEMRNIYITCMESQKLSSDNTVYAFINKLLEDNNDLLKTLFKMHNYFVPKS